MASKKSEKAERPKNKPTRGILDFIDILAGRLSSRTDSDGERIRSWGVTYNFWMTIPAVFLIFCFGISVVITASSTRAHVPRKLVKEYRKCITKLIDAKKFELIKDCKAPTAQTGKSLSTKLLEFGMWPWIAVLYLATLGFTGMVMRNKDDTTALTAIADSMSVYVTKEKSVPKDVWDAFKAQLTKVTGSKTPPPEPDKPDGPGVVK